MQPRWLAFPLLASLLLSAGCWRAMQTAKVPAAPAKQTVGFSVLTMTNPFFKEIGDTFTAEMARNGYDAVVVSGDNDQARQKAQVEDFLTKGVSAIVLCPCHSQTVGEAIRLANLRGVPVFTADIASLDDAIVSVARFAQPSVGRTTCAEILHGARNAKVRRNSYDGLPGYGTSSNMRRADILARIDQLIADGAIATTPGPYPVLKVPAAAAA